MRGVEGAGLAGETLERFLKERKADAGHVNLVPVLSAIKPSQNFVFRAFFLDAVKCLTVFFLSVYGLSTDIAWSLVLK
jgi:hypothetical protein